MTVYIEEPKKFTKKILEIICELARLQSTQINCISYILATNNHTLKLNMKYLRINLTKGVQDLYTKNHKTLLKEIKEK